MTSPRNASSLVARSRRGFELEQFRRGVDQRGRRRAGAEGLVVDDVFEERNVRLHAADAELAQRAVHALQAPGRKSRPEAVTFTSSES